MARFLILLLLTLLPSPAAYAQLLGQSDDWRDNLDYYHGKKPPKLEEKSDKRPLSGQACVNHCLARGTLPDVCNEQCGTVRDEGVFYDPGYGPYDRPPEYDEEEGYGSGGGDFSGVDYTCFRECRLSGDSFDTCKGMCKSR